MWRSLARGAVYIAEYYRDANREKFLNYIQRQQPYYNIFREVPASCARRFIPKDYKNNYAYMLPSHIKIK
jgi:hypothetical protein